MKPTVRRRETKLNCELARAFRIGRRRRCRHLEGVQRHVERHFWRGLHPAELGCRARGTSRQLELGVPEEPTGIFVTNDRSQPRRAGRDKTEATLGVSGDLGGRVTVTVARVDAYLRGRVLVSLQGDGHRG